MSVKIYVHDHPDGIQVATARSLCDGRKLRVIGDNAFHEMKKTLQFEANRFVKQELKRLFP